MSKFAQSMKETPATEINGGKLAECHVTMVSVKDKQVEEERRRQAGSDAEDEDEQNASDAFSDDGPNAIGEEGAYSDEDVDYEDSDPVANQSGMNKLSKGMGKGMNKLRRKGTNAKGGDAADEGAEGGAAADAAAAAAAADDDDDGGEDEDDAALAENLDSLQTGDVVYLSSMVKGKGVRETGLLHAEGKVRTRVGMQVDRGRKVTDRFNECLFRVCPALKYEAGTSVKARGGGGNQSMAHSELHFLMREAGQEQESNAKTLAAVEEQPAGVLYGGVVQLQHVRSGGFLTARNEQAEVNKATLKLEVDPAGSSYSFFRIMPRFKIRQEGGLIYFHDQILLQSVNLGDQYICPWDKAFEAPKGDDLTPKEVGTSANLPAHSLIILLYSGLTYLLTYPPTYLPPGLPTDLPTDLPR